MESESGSVHLQVGVLGWQLHLPALKQGRRGKKKRKRNEKKKQVTCLVSGALKTLGRLRREVVGC